VVASLGTGQSPWDYYDELAKDHVISTSAVELMDEPMMARDAPYVWQYQMGLDNLERNLGNWACAQLAGRPASHAAGIDTATPPRPMNTDTRVFGAILNNEDSSITPSDRPLRDALAECGATLAASVTVPYGSNDTPEYQNAMVTMRSKGVTTIFTLAHILVYAQLSSAASSESYFPEWLVTNYEYLGTDGYQHAFHQDSSQLRDTFGLLSEPMEWRISEHMEYQAKRSVDPTYDPSTSASPFAGVGPGTAASAGTGLAQEVEDNIYHSILLLASGLQMAGPHLTPESFAAGLHRTVFPNPENWQMEGKVGFPGDNHAMTTDVAELWWSPTAPSPYPDEGSGAFCYVNGGERFALGGFPRQDTAFQGPCFDGA
jgi:hypothetical protein